MTQPLSLCRFGVAPPDLSSVQKGTAVYHSEPLPHVRIGSRTFPWHSVVEFAIDAPMPEVFPELAPVPYDEPVHVQETRSRSVKARK